MLETVKIRLFSRKTVVIYESTRSKLQRQIRLVF